MSNHIGPLGTVWPNLSGSFRKFRIAALRIAAGRFRRFRRRLSQVSQDFVKFRKFRRAAKFRRDSRDFGLSFAALRFARCENVSQRASYRAQRATKVSPPGPLSVPSVPRGFRRPPRPRGGLA